MESVSNFPPPPGYSALFAREEKSEDVESSDKEESFPVPPPEPVEGQYVVFGETQETQTGIPRLPVEQLFDANEDIKSELHRLHAEVLQTYSELIETVASSPERYARLTERIGVVIRNMLQLVNLLRPYQALASMKEFLANGVRVRKEALKDIEKCKEAALELLNAKHLNDTGDEEQAV